MNDTPDWANKFKKPSWQQPSNNTRVNIATLTISQKGLKFIIDFEKHSLKIYNDSNNYCTIGIGHLIEQKSCKNIKNSAKFNKIQNSDIYNNNISKNEILNGITKQKEVRHSVHVPLYQYEFDALVSLFFNSGGAQKKPKLIKYLNSGTEQGYYQASKEFLDIIDRGSKSEHGLKIRRNAEVKMFREGIYDSKH